MLKLRHKVNIQFPTETQNAYGEPVPSWSNLAEGVWASILPLSGREFFAAKQMNSEVEVKIGMRWRPDITAKMKIVHGPTCVCKSTATEEYMIETPINVNGRNRELQIMCMRFVP